MLSAWEVKLLLFSFPIIVSHVVFDFLQLPAWESMMTLTGMVVNAVCVKCQQVSTSKPVRISLS